MPIPDESAPIDDDEILYRRIPAALNLYDPNAEPRLLPDAFRPNQNDTTGLSVYRARYRAIEDVARGREGKKYYVAVLRAGDLGHAELPGLTYQDRKSDEALEWKALLAQQLCLRVEGPFPP